MVVELVCALLVPVLCALLLLGAMASTTFGAALGGDFGLGGDYRYNSSAVNYGTLGSAGFDLMLDPQQVSFRNAQWQFNVNTYDPAYWSATCALYGDRNSSEAWPQNQGWSQRITKGDVTVGAYLSFSVQAEWWTSTGQTFFDPQMNVHGYMDVQPASINYSNFDWYESMREEYTWPGGYENDPVIVQIPTWCGRLDINGQFVAPTMTEARAIGQSYLNAVPEPSSRLMMAIGIGMAIGTTLVCRRGRRR